MFEQHIPRADFGVCGGSATLANPFPHGCGDQDVEVLAEDLVFDTPFGRSPAITHFRVMAEDGPREALSVRMHGWRRGVKRADASLQTFWVFAEAGVSKVISDGGVGSLNHLLDPRDVLVPNDFVDLTVRKDIYVRGDHLLIMRQPVCPSLHSMLYEQATKSFTRVFPRGVYVVTDGPRFESVAEVEWLRSLGDVVGQSFAPEVVLARDIGACFAGVYMVVNYGEGVVKEWEHAELKHIFTDESDTIARCVLATIRHADLSAPCPCLELRKPSLLEIPDEREEPPRSTTADPERTG